MFNHHRVEKVNIAGLVFIDGINLMVMVDRRSLSILRCLNLEIYEIS